MIRSITEIGAMWPKCKNCGHIAQDHDTVGCGSVKKGQCPTCHTWQDRIPCDCKEYIGPTWDEFKTQLTPEEMAHYHYK